MDALTHKVLRTVRRFSLVRPGQRVLTALSGGPDSVALLLVLQDLAPHFDIQLSAAHVNHGLRGLESDEDEVFVRRFCERQDVRLFVERLPFASAGKGPNMEARIRALRYERLAALALRERSVLATGHTLNDQAETMLLKLLRGAGPTGMSGVFPARTIRRAGGRVRVVRPLLDTGREDILAYLEGRRQAYCSDRSNADLSLDRNWVRLRLLPLLESRLNPSLTRVLGRNAEVFREMEEFLDLHARDALASCLVEDKQEVVLAAGQLTALPAIVRKQVIRLALRKARGNLEGVTQAHVVSASELVEKGSGRAVQLPGGWRVQREFDTLRITGEDSPCDFEVELKIPGQVLLESDGRRVSARRLDSPPSDLEPVGPRILLANLPGDTIRVRNRRPGDRLIVNGRERPLKKLFLEKKIPRGRRSRSLVMTCGNHLVWVEGLGTSGPHTAEEGARGVVEILIH